MLPAKAWNCLQLGMAIDRFGRDPDVCVAPDQHIHDIVRAALSQLDVNVRKLLAEPHQNRRQDVIGLIVSGSDHQPAAVGLGKLLG